MWSFCIIKRILVGHVDLGSFIFPALPAGICPFSGATFAIRSCASNVNSFPVTFSRWTTQVYDFKGAGSPGTAKYFERPSVNELKF